MPAMPERFCLPDPQHARFRSVHHLPEAGALFHTDRPRLVPERVGIEALWQEMTALAVIGLAILGLSAMRFHKRLDWR
jgi:hypothetical protein